MKSFDRWQIHRLLATNTNERLNIVRQIPKHIALVGADADISHHLLATRYPKATFTEYDSRDEFLTIAAEARKTGFWKKLSGKQVVQHHQPLTQPLPEAIADMLWANLSLITATNLTEVFDNWSKHLKVDGLLFFTHFGGDSLVNIISHLNKQGIQCTAPTLMDMHDLGDMLLQHGFYDPVMDTEKIILSYQNSTAFWEDMKNLGLWNALQCEDSDAVYQAINQLFHQEQPYEVTLEILYGHAVKKRQLPEGESVIEFMPQHHF